MGVISSPFQDERQAGARGDDVTPIQTRGTRMKIVIADFIEKHDSLEPERRILGDLAEIIPLDAHSEQELTGQVEDADALVLYHNLRFLSRDSITRMARCKLIVRAGVGFDNLDYAFARSR